MRNENLIAAREQSGKTKVQVAKEIGVSVRMYQDYELLGSEPRARMANKIARTLGTTVEKLWGYENTTAANPA